MTKILFPLALVSVLVFPATAEAQAGPYAFYPLTPCRVVDTRNAASVNGGPALGTTTREFSIRGNCGVPSTAKAVAINVTVTNASTSSWLTIWPAGLAKPFISIINFSPSDPALANGAIVGLGSGSRDLAVQNAIGSVHVIIDVTGYFQ
jgi:hypothetical protein